MQCAPSRTLLQKIIILLHFGSLRTLIDNLILILSIYYKINNMSIDISRQFEYI